MRKIHKKFISFKLKSSHALLISAAFGLAPMAMAQTAPQITSDAANVYYQFPYSGTPTWVRVYVDTDRNANTGFRGYNVGSSFLIENGNLYRYSGSNGAWGWTYVKRVSSTAIGGVAKVIVSKADLGYPSALDAVTQTSSPLITSSKLTLASTAVATTTTLAATTTTTRAATTSTAAATTTTAAATTTTRAATTTTAAPTTTLAATTTTTRAATTTTVATTTTTTQAATGPTYYLSPNGNDSNSGSASAPWRTIQKAANTVNAGDTVVMMDGTYTQGSVGFNRSGTAAKPITFKAQNKWKAIVASTSGCQPGFSINASYITVKDMVFRVAGSACGTYTSANVHIRAWNTANPTPSSPSSGSAGFRADGIKLEGGTARSEGLKSNQDYTIIENVEADNTLELFNVKDSIIRNSLVTGQDIYGISIFAKGGVRNAQIYNNVVRNKHSDGYGIYLGGYSCDTCFFDPSTKIEAYNSVAYNNVVINEGSGNLNALVFAGAKDSAFFNNVVIGGGVVTLQGGHNSGFRANTTNPTLMNNIIMCKNRTGFSGTYAGTLKADSNNFYQCSGVPSQTNAITGDPLLINAASDWNLQSTSPARNRGAAASIIGYDGRAIDVSRDKNGAVRSAPWDLGIYNY